jgi:predicted aspartyl protease
MEVNMGLNIASAFRLRNKLKERIKKLSEISQRAEVTKQIGTLENVSTFDGKTFNETVAEVSFLMATLQNFNIAIDKANEVNREDLIGLETLKAEIAFYDFLTQKIRQAPRISYEYNKEGGRDKIEMEFLLDQKAVVSHLEILKKKKDEIEEKLADSNFKTEVNFDKSIIEKLL